MRKCLNFVVLLTIRLMTLDGVLSQKYDPQSGGDENYLTSLAEYAIQVAELELEGQSLNHHRSARNTLEFRHTYVKFSRSTEEIGKFSLTNIRAYDILINRLGVPKQRALDMLNKHIPAICKKPAVKCDLKKKYSSIDGRCNNLGHPDWGASFIAFRRLVPHAYHDDLDIPRGGRKFSSLPNARLVSTTVHPDLIQGDPILTNMVGQFGQFVDHDLTLTPEADQRCCAGQKHVNCWPITISPNDTFHSTRTRPQLCMDFTRSTAFCFPTPSGKREQMNILTAYADASQVYGSTSEREKQVRSFKKGKLRANEDNPKLLPTAEQVKRESHIEAEFEGLFIAGDERVNEMPALAVLHTLFMREHNRIAEQIAAIKADWDDDHIFEETRRIVVAEWQNIVFDEYLPIIMGPKAMREHGLALGSPSTYSDYHPGMDATISHSFATAAYRFGHTLINGIIKLMKGLHEIGSYRLRDNFFNDAQITSDNGNGYNLILGGLVNQSAQVYDPFVTEDLTNFLLRQKTDDFGSDLIARNIQRGRDHGLQGYNAYRGFCGLPSLTHWGNRPVESIESSWNKLKKLYSSPMEIDLFTGGLIEKSVDGALTGPTFNCLKGEQFHRIKSGDRFFFTHRNQVGSWKQDQLIHIRSRKYSDIICDNSDLEDIPKNVFNMASDKNPRIKCAANESPTRTILNVALLIN